MPELPEVRAHAERLTEAYSGASLIRFSAISFTALKTASPSPDSAVGNELVRVGTRGKLLVLDFSPVSFVVHLMQGGRLKPDEKQSARPQGGLARWVFADERALLLTEAGKDRKAGVWVREDDPETHEPLDDLGPDADTVSVDQLREIVRSHSSMRLHGFLRDQHGVAGLGRRLANEICHRAKLSPFVSTTKLDDNDIGRLHEAMMQCIDESLEYERSRSDMSSSKERPGAVHHRTTEACPVCGDVVRAVEYNRYTVNYCATCQTGGKVLADNTTSRFLK